MTGLLSLFLLSAAAAPTANLNTLAARYQCGYATQDQQIQCVLGSLRFLCWQEATVARVGYGLPDTDPANQSFFSCAGGTAADPFSSEQSSWAAAEVYYERGKDSLAARVQTGALKARGTLYRHDPGTAAAHVVQPTAASIGEACKAADYGQQQTRARIAQDPSFPAYEASWIQRMQVSASGYAKCQTVVKNGWASAVGVPIIVVEAMLSTSEIECKVRPASCPK